MVTKQIKWQDGAWESDQANVKITKVLEGGKTEIPFTIESVTWEPSDKILKEVLLERQGDVEVYELYMLDEAVQDDDLLSKITEPFTATFTGKPAPEHQPKEGPPIELERKVTVKIVPPPLVMEVADPKPPVHADGQAQTLTIEASREPYEIKKEEVSLRNYGGVDPAGTMSTTSLTIENGETTVEYTPPSLVYAVGGDYVEKWVPTSVPFGDEGQTLDMKLAPEVEASFTVEKHGFEMQPGKPLVLTHAESRDKVEATLLLPVKSWMVNEEREVPVANARVKLLVGKAQNAVEFPQELISSEEGKIEWELPELTEAFEETDREGEVVTVDQPNQLPEIRLNAECEKRAEDYEVSYTRGAPVKLLSPELANDLKTYRFVYAEQLGKAEDDEEAVKRIIGASELLTVSTVWTSFYDRQYADSNQLAWDRWWDFVKEVIGTVLDFVDWGAKFGDLGKAVSDKVGNTMKWSTHKEWIEKAVKWLGDLAGQIKDQVLGAVRSLGGQIDEGLEQLLENFVELIYSATGKRAVNQPSWFQSIAGVLLSGAQMLVKALSSIVLAPVGMIAGTIWAGAVGSAKFLDNMARPVMQRFETFVETSIHPVFEQRVAQWKMVDYSWEPDVAAGSPATFAWNKLMGGYAKSFFGAAYNAIHNLAMPDLGPILPPYFANYWLRDAYDNASKLWIPEDPRAAAVEYRSWASWVRQVNVDRENLHGDLNMLIQLFDDLVLWGELMAMVVSVLASGGIFNPITMMPFLDMMEKVLGVLKSMFRLCFQLIPDIIISPFPLGVYAGAQANLFGEPARG